MDGRAQTNHEFRSDQSFDIQCATVCCPGIYCAIESNVFRDCVCDGGHVAAGQDTVHTTKSVYFSFTAHSALSDGAIISLTPLTSIHTPTLRPLVPATDLVLFPRHNQNQLRPTPSDRARAALCVSGLQSWIQRGVCQGRGVPETVLP